MGNRYRLFVIVLLSIGLAQADESELPSLELLEFLTEATQIDGQWMDPVRMNELTQSRDSALNEESSGDE